MNRISAKMRCLVGMLLLFVLSSLASAQWAAIWGGPRDPVSIGGQFDVPADLDHVISLQGGPDFSIALKSDGTVVQWGDLGAPPSGLSGVVAIAAGNGHALALKSDGTVVAWGSNYTHECDIPAGLTGVTAVAAGTGQSYALKSDGTVVAWGQSTYVPIGLSHVTAISASNGHVLALLSDGTVAGWGDGFGGAAYPPAGLTNVKAICTAADHTVALKKDGTVVSWGKDPYLTYSLDPPAGLKDVAEVSACFRYTLVRKIDGTLVGWGDQDRDFQNYPPKAKALGKGHLSLMAIIDDFGVFLDAATVAGGSTTELFGRVKLSTSRATDTTVHLSSGSALAAVPTTVVIPAGATEISFPVLHELTNDLQTVVVTATGVGLGGKTFFYLNPILIKDVHVNTAILGGDTKVAKLYLDFAPRDPAVITLTSSNPTAFTVPPTVTVPGGSNYVTFNLRTYDLPTRAQGWLKADYGTHWFTHLITVNPGPQRVVTLTLNPNPVEGGKSCTGTVSLVRSPATPVTVLLSSTDPTAAALPASVIVPAGSTTATFAVTTPTVTANAFPTITAWVDGTPVQSVRLTVKRQPVVKSVTFPTVYGNQQATGVVTLSTPATVGGTTVTLSTDVAGLTIPASVLVPEGQTTVSFPVQSADVSIGTTVVVTASDASNSVNRHVTVKPNTPSTITLSQTSLHSGQSCTATVTLAGVVRSNTSVTVLLSSTLLSGPATVTVPAGSNTVSFTVTAGTITKASTAYVRANRFAKTLSAAVSLSP